MKTVASIEKVEPVLCPFIIAVDTREQAPWHFLGFKADAKHNVKIKPADDDDIGPQIMTPDLIVETKREKMRTGDYSIVGHDSEICVERKSLPDLFGTIASGRDRFIRELQRMSDMKVAAVVIEGNCDAAMRNPPKNSKLSPKAVFRSINAWEQDFPNIHFHWMGSRSIAEHKCFRILERFWKKQIDPQ